MFAWDSVDQTWKQRGADIDGEAVWDESGTSVSLSADGTALAVGAPNNNGAGIVGQPIFSDKVYNIFNRELQKYQ